MVIKWLLLSEMQLKQINDVQVLTIYLWAWVLFIYLFFSFYKKKISTYLSDTIIFMYFVSLFSVIPCDALLWCNVMQFEWC